MTAPSADATVLALDLGGTQIRAAVVRADGTRIGRAASVTPLSGGPAAIITTCISTLQQARAAAHAEDPAATARIVGIGISAPGPLDPWRGIAVETPNLGPTFPGTDLAGPISAALHLPALLEHDTKVAILGERAFGAGRGIDDLLYITISTGLGGAVISDGRLYTGPDDTGIEIGHAPITLDGPRCSCGGIGHLEAHASGVALARTGGEAAASGASPWLAAWLAAHPKGQVSAKEVTEGAAAGDRVAQGLIDHALLAISRAVAGFVNVFNPTRIIIGGSFAEAHWEGLHSRIQGEIGDNSFKVPGRRVSVHPAELGGDVSLAGCHPMVVGRIGYPEWERVVAVKSKGDTR
jgi:glucokinase